MTRQDPTTSSATGGGTRRFVLFVASGGCAAAVNWLSRFPLAHFMSFSAAVVVAYMIGMVVAFALYSQYVFPASRKPFAAQFRFFLLVNLAGIAQVLAVSMVLIYYAFPAIGFSESLAEAIGHGIAIAVPTVPSYFGHNTNSC